MLCVLVPVSTATWGVVFYTHMNGYLGIPGMAGIRRAHGHHGHHGHLNQAGAGPAPGPGRMGITGIRVADGYPQGTWVSRVSDGYPMGIPRVSHGPRVSRPWLGTGRYKLGKGTKKRREMIVCFITHLIKMDP